MKPPLVRIVLFGLTYFVGAELGHVLSFEVHDQTIATLWPPGGLFVATLALTSPHSWWPLLLAAGCANLCSDVFLHEKTLCVSLGFFLANGVEACLGAALLRRFAGAPLTLGRIRHVVGLGLFSALLSTVVGATIGAVVVVQAFDGLSYFAVWQTWWLADAVSVLVFAPVILAWGCEPPGMVWVRGVRGRTEAVLVFTGLVLMGQAVYGEWLPPPFTVPIFLLPFLLWIGLRFGPRSAAAAVVIIALIGVGATSQGRGPYAALSSSPRHQALRAQGTLGVVSLCVMLLAAAASERRQAEQEKLALIAELQAALAEIKTLRGLIPICAWCNRLRDDIGSWQKIESYLRARADVEFSHGICPECLERQYAPAGTR